MRTLGFAGRVCGTGSNGEALQSIKEALLGKHVKIYGQGEFPSADLESFEAELKSYNEDFENRFFGKFGEEQHDERPAGALYIHNL